MSSLSLSKTCPYFVLDNGVIYDDEVTCSESWKCNFRWTVSSFTSCWNVFATSFPVYNRQHSNTGVNSGLGICVLPWMKREKKRNLKQHGRSVNIVLFPTFLPCAHLRGTAHHPGPARGLMGCWAAAMQPALLVQSSQQLLHIQQAAAEMQPFAFSLSSSSCSSCTASCWFWSEHRGASLPFQFLLFWKSQRSGFTTEAITEGS